MAPKGLISRVVSTQVINNWPLLVIDVVAQTWHDPQPVMRSFPWRQPLGLIAIIPLW